MVAVPHARDARSAIGLPIPCTAPHQLNDVAGVGWSMFTPLRMRLQLSFADTRGCRGPGRLCRCTSVQKYKCATTHQTCPSNLLLPSHDNFLFDHARSVLRTPPLASCFDMNATAERVGWVAEPTGRGTFGLIVSCATTIFLCTYSAVHLNLPGLDESAWTIQMRRISIMLGCICAPEYFAGVAVDEFLYAQNLKKDVRRNILYCTCVSGQESRTNQISIV